MSGVQERREIRVLVNDNVVPAPSWDYVNAEKLVRTVSKIKQLFYAIFIPSIQMMERHIL